MPTLAIYGLVALGLFVSGLGTGWKVASDHFQAEQIEAVNAAVDKVRGEAVAANTEAQKLEEKKDEVRVVYKTITKQVDRIVERSIYRDACFDDDGLRAANAALAGTAPDPGKPDAALPAADPPR